MMLCYSSEENDREGLLEGAKGSQPDVTLLSTWYIILSLCAILCLYAIITSRDVTLAHVTSQYNNRYHPTGNRVPKTQLHTSQFTTSVRWLYSPSYHVSYIISHDLRTFRVYLSLCRILGFVLI